MLKVQLYLPRAWTCAQTSPSIPEDKSRVNFDTTLWIERTSIVGMFFPAFHMGIGEDLWSLCQISLFALSQSV